MRIISCNDLITELIDMLYSMKNKAFCNMMVAEGAKESC
ncbi:hypothetical protein SFK227_5292 [Shigella flexneri K-227]|uniref:Uncharacterized protein n=1 Tax=Shigella flexneri K-227 TaxID=766147 RepID=F5P446_SHIFL|nr:hypothetical protein SFK227_5292 [Shigella flexneri K-227]